MNAELQAQLEAAAEAIYQRARENPAEPPACNALQIALNLYGGSALDEDANVVGYRISAGPTISVRLGNGRRTHLNVARALAWLNYPALPGRELAMALMAPAPAVLSRAPLGNWTPSTLAVEFVMPLECARLRLAALRLRAVAGGKKTRAARKARI